MKRKLPEGLNTVWGWMLGYLEDYGVFPTRGEIAHHFGFTRAAAEKHIKRLVVYGRIELTNESERNIKLVK